MTFILPRSRKILKPETEPIVTVLTTGFQPHYKVKSSTAVTDDGILFLFGGFDEDDVLDSNVYLLDLKTNAWSIHRHDVTREGHSSIYIGNGNILVFGGVPDESSNSFQMLIYDTNQFKWINPPEFTLLNQPSQRSRHASCLSEDGTKMYISGGLITSTPLDDLYCYDLITGKWEGPMKFVCRFDHFITVFQNKIYSFGGLNKEMNHVRSQITWFDLSNNMIGEISMINSTNLLGDHVYLNSINSSVKLDITMPIWNSIHEGVQSCIATYDIKHLKWQMLLTGRFKPLIDHRWKHTFIYNDNLYLLGYPLTTENSLDVTSFDYKLSTIIKIELTSLGILRTDQADYSSSNNKNSKNSLSYDLSKFFNNENWSDFEIITLNTNERIVIEDEVNEKMKVSLKVHKAILLARWPHFRRLMSSGMNESISNKMFIPEPVNWVRGLLQYLYTDSIEGYSLEELSGILILSNLYELNNLRKMTLSKIYKEINYIKSNKILRIWSNFLISNEFYLIQKINQLISLNWNKIVQSEEFEKLPKHLIIRLCQDCAQNMSVPNSIGYGDGGKGDDSNELVLMKEEISNSGVIKEPLLLTDYNEIDQEQELEEDIEETELSNSEQTINSTMSNNDLIFEELRRENSNSPFLMQPTQVSHYSASHDFLRGDDNTSSYARFVSDETSSPNNTNENNHIADVIDNDENMN